MDKFAIAVGMGLLVTLVMALIAPAAVLGGAIAGYTVEWLWPQTSADLLAYLHITLPLWKVGAGLGFVGFFIKPTVNSSKSKD